MQNAKYHIAILFTEKVWKKCFFSHIMPKKCWHNQEGPTIGFLLNVGAPGARRVVKSLLLARKLAFSDREVERRFLT